jgi:hypothetical protein
MILAINGLAEASGTAAGGGKINILDEKKWVISFQQILNYWAN